MRKQVEIKSSPHQQQVVWEEVVVAVQGCVEMLLVVLDDGLLVAKVQLASWEHCFAIWKVGDHNLRNVSLVVVQMLLISLILDRWMYKQAFGAMNLVVCGCVA